VPVQAQHFNLEFRSDATQTVNATDHRVEDGWVNFYDDNGKVLSVPDKDVLSVARAGVEDRKHAPSAHVASVRLSR
jgi:hypothetical protein